METLRIAVHIIVDSQIGVRISQRIHHLEGTQILWIRERTDYDRLAVRGTEIGIIDDLTAVSNRTEGLIVVDEATSVELNHHRLEVRIQLRQDDIGIKVRVRGMYAQGVRVAHTCLVVTAGLITGHRTVVLVSLTLDEPLIAVLRFIIGDTGLEADRLEVEGVIYIASQDIVGFVVIRLIETPFESAITLRIERLTEGTER